MLEYLDEDCVGRHFILERYVFFSRQQGEHESIQDYVAALRKQASACDFDRITPEQIIRDRIVCGLHDDRQRQALLSRAKLTLKECILECRANEQSKKQAADMRIHNRKPESTSESSDASSVNTISKSSKGTGCPVAPLDMVMTRRGCSCRYCGRHHQRGAIHCPAYGQRCIRCHAKKRCHAKNHFATVCQKRSVRFCTELTSNCDERQGVAVVTTIDSEHPSVRKSVDSVSTMFASKIFATLEIASKPISFQIDSGASCNVVRSQDLANTNASITATTQRLCLYDNSVLEPVGKTEVQVYNPKTRKRHLAEFVVVHKAATAILGAATSQELGLMKVCSENILNMVHAANSVSLLTRGNYCCIPMCLL